MTREQLAENTMNEGGSSAGIDTAWTQADSPDVLAHTPTPWSKEANSFGTQFIHGNPSEPRTSPMGITYYDLICGGDHPGALTEANAAFIVKAVNSHDALVKALERLDSFLDFGDEKLETVWTFDSVDGIQEAFSQAREALASIKDSQP